MRSQMKFMRVQILWMLATLLALIAFDLFSLYLFITASLVGYIVLTDLTSPLVSQPPWRQRLRWIGAFGFLAFVFLMVEKFV